MTAEPADETVRLTALGLRRRLGVWFAALILCLYFGFTLTIAFYPQFLSIGAPFSVGFGLIILIMAAVVILNAVYMNFADENRAPISAHPHETGE